MSSFVQLKITVSQIGKQCKQVPVCSFLQTGFPANLQKLLAGATSPDPFDIIGDDGYMIIQNTTFIGYEFR